MIGACAGQLSRNYIVANVQGAAAGVACVCSCLYMSASPTAVGVLCFICQEDIGLGSYGVFFCGHYMHQECHRNFLEHQFGLILLSHLR